MTRRLARMLNRQRNLPQRMLREWRWMLRDLRDVRSELRRWKGFDVK